MSPAAAREVLGAAEQSLERVLLEVRLCEGLPAASALTPRRAGGVRTCTGWLVDGDAWALVACC